MKNVFKFTRLNTDTRKIENTGSMKINSVSDEKAEIYFYGDICSESWQSYYYEEDKCPQDIANFLSQLGANRAIDIYINSGGGSVSGGLAIYNQLKRHQGFKTVYFDGIVASIASVIAMCGDKIIMPNTSQMMVHKPSSAVWGNADDMRKEADALDSCQETIISAYMSKVRDGILKETVEEMVNRETWFTATATAEYFDVEIDTVGEAVAACSSTYYSKYKNIPQDLRENKTNNRNEVEILQLELDLLNA